jgi:hypothetical protein
MSIVFDEVSATIERPQQRRDEEQPEEESRPTAVSPSHALIQLRRELERLQRRQARLQAD